MKRTEIVQIQELLPFFYIKKLKFRSLPYCLAVCRNKATIYQKALHKLAQFLSLVGNRVRRDRPHLCIAKAPDFSLQRDMLHCKAVIPSLL